MSRPASKKSALNRIIRAKTVANSIQTHVASAVNVASYDQNSANTKIDWTRLHQALLDLRVSGAGIDHQMKPQSIGSNGLKTRNVFTLKMQTTIICRVSLYGHSGLHCLPAIIVAE